MHLILTRKVRPLVDQLSFIHYELFLLCNASCLTITIGLDALEKNRSKHVVAPAINWLIATLYDAVMFGYSTEKAEEVGYRKELDAADRAMREMHRRGIVILPGG